MPWMAMLITCIKCGQFQMYMNFTFFCINCCKYLSTVDKCGSMRQNKLQSSMKFSVFFNSFPNQASNIQGFSTTQIIIKTTLL